ncbi:unnamed protein product, partial [Sphacelaria rigidula]
MNTGAMYIGGKGRLLHSQEAVLTQHQLGGNITSLATVLISEECLVTTTCRAPDPSKMCSCCVACGEKSKNNTRMLCYEHGEARNHMMWAEIPNPCATAPNLA